MHVLHAWGMTEMSPLGTVVHAQAQAPRAVGRAAAARCSQKQGRALFGVDMKIVGDDGEELPWDGGLGDLLVRGPWVVASTSRATAAIRCQDAEGTAGFRPATWPRSTPTATCRSPTARRT